MSFFLGTDPLIFLEQGQKFQNPVPRKQNQKVVAAQRLLGSHFLEQHSWNTEHIGGCRSPPYVSREGISLAAASDQRSGAGLASSFAKKQAGAAIR